MRVGRRSLCGLGALILCAGCVDDPTVPEDSGAYVLVDAAVRDAGDDPTSLDAAAGEDAGAPADASSEASIGLEQDAGHEDGGTEATLDAGHKDGGAEAMLDAAAADGGAVAVLDAATQDGGGQQGMVDASVPDGGNLPAPDASTDAATPEPTLDASASVDASGPVYGSGPFGSCAEAEAELASKIMHIGGLQGIDWDAGTSVTVPCESSERSVFVFPFELEHATDMVYDIHRTIRMLGADYTVGLGRACGSVDWCELVGDAEIIVETLQPGAYFLYLGQGRGNYYNEMIADIRAELAQPPETNVTCEQAIDGLGAAEFRAATEHYYRLELAETTPIWLYATMASGHWDWPEFYLEVFADCPGTTPIGSAIGVHRYAAELYFAQDGLGPLPPGTYWIRLRGALGTRYELTFQRPLDPY